VHFYYALFVLSINFSRTYDFFRKRYLKNIMTQVLHNMDMSKNIGIGTDEQKNAIESTTKAIEHVNEIVGEMVGEIHRLSETSNVIFGNANELMEISKKAT